MLDIYICSYIYVVYIYTIVVYVYIYIYNVNTEGKPQLQKTNNLITWLTALSNSKKL